MSKHTPGPWRFQDNGNWQTNPYSVVISAKGVHSTTVANIPARRSIPSWEWESNARLIAAAPDLLKALETIMAGVAGCERAQMYEAARAAINKATGEIK